MLIGRINWEHSPSFRLKYSIFTAYARNRPRKFPSNGWANGREFTDIAHMIRGVNMEILKFQG